MQHSYVKRKVDSHLLMALWIVMLAFVPVSGCVRMANTDLWEDKARKAFVFGLVEVRPTGTYSRGFQTQLRFFHLLNRQTQERIRVDVQSAAKAFVLALTPGEYEVIRVQINEGPMMMESHTNLRFDVSQNTVTYLGTWIFNVDSPRTQRMLRTGISPELPNQDELAGMDLPFNEKMIVASLPTPRDETVRLFLVAPNPKIGFYYR